jgi:two-component system, NtrC family, sensor kinase
MNPSQAHWIRFSQVVQRFSTNKWQYLYGVLAAFNVLTISASLFANHQIMTIYAQSVEVNQQWANRLQRYSDVSRLLAEMNAPGNNLFESQNVALESNRLQVAQTNFQTTIRAIRQELHRSVAATEAAILLRDLDAVEQAMAQMVTEAALIFAYFRQKQPAYAGRRMAAMDQSYHEANQALAEFRYNVSQIQHQQLAHQKQSAYAFERYQTAIAWATVVVVGGVSIYGHQLAQKMKSDAREKEHSIDELQRAEALLHQQNQELQLALATLQNTQLQLLQSEKMSSLGQLVAGIAHEINNPVGFIAANLIHIRDYSRDLLYLIQLARESCFQAIPALQAEAELIDLEFIESDLPKTLHSMQVGTDRIRDIVISLRSFSRLDEAELKTVDIHAGLESALLILQHRFKSTSSGIELSKNYGDLCSVECYAGQLNQVFMNILTNALDALEEAEKTHDRQRLPEQQQIKISTDRLGTDWIQIAIADNGPGMSAQIQQRIFEPFFTTKPVGKGTGLGMSISYQIVQENHHGKLECFSTPERGTEFVITIPVCQPKS